MSANELDVARAIASGELSSPQKFGNVWLFALRVSGTGVAYRPKHNEYVLRRQDGYLTQEFLARCNGLPILWQHPPTDVLNSDEFSKRIIGTLFLPYLQGEEVWGIAKIYNEEAAQRMQDEQLSTSPGVVATVLLRGKIKVEGEGGSEFIVEGPPSVADHLAIVANGVWDKGGPPEGVRADEEKGRSMPEQGELLDKVLAGIDSIGKRMDAIEGQMTADKKRRADEEESKRTDARKRADAFRFSHRKDGEDDESYKKRHDAEEEDLKKLYGEAGEAEQVAADSTRKARADSSGQSLRQPIYQDHTLWSRDVAEAQARADEAYQTFGKQAPPPLAGEVLKNYERRLLQPLLKYSPRWKDVDLVKIATDSAAFGVVQTQVYEDVRADGGRSDVAEGEIRYIQKRHPITGLPIHEGISSDGGTFIRGMMPPVKKARINMSPGSRLSLQQTKVSS